MANPRQQQDTPPQRTAPWPPWLQGLAFNLLCGLYFWALAPIVIDAANHSVQGDKTIAAPWLGVLLIVLSVAEAWALPRKMAQVNRTLSTQNTDPGNVPIFLWVFHTLIGVVTIFMALETFGFDFDTIDSQSPQWWLVGIFLLVVLKEIYLLLTFIGTDQDASNNAPPTPKEHKLALGADLVMVAHTCVLYTVVWQSGLEQSGYVGENLAITLLNALAMSLVFFILYLPLRIPYFVQEICFAKTLTQKIRLGASLMLPLAPALLAPL